MNEQGKNGVSFFMDYFKARAAGASVEAAMLSAGATKGQLEPQQIAPSPETDVDDLSTRMELLSEGAAVDGFCGLEVLQTMIEMVTATDAASAANLEGLGIDRAAQPQFRKAFAAITVEALQLHLDPHTVPNNPTE